MLHQLPDTILLPPCPFRIESSGPDRFGRCKSSFLTGNSSRTFYWRFRTSYRNGLMSHPTTKKKKKIIRTQETGVVYRLRLLNTTHGTWDDMTLLETSPISCSLTPVRVPTRYGYTDSDSFWDLGFRGHSKGPTVIR